MSHCTFNTQWDKNYAVGADDRRGWGFLGQKTFSHPPKAFNHHLILLPAVQSKCQGFGEEIWSSFESLQTHSHWRGAVTLVPTQVQVREIRWAWGGVGAFVSTRTFNAKTPVWAMLNTKNHFFPITFCPEGSANTFIWGLLQALYCQTVTHTFRCHENAVEKKA